MKQEISLIATVMNACLPIIEGDSDQDDVAVARAVVRAVEITLCERGQMDNVLNNGGLFVVGKTDPVFAEKEIIRAAYYKNQGSYVLNEPVTEPGTVFYRNGPIGSLEVTEEPYEVPTAEFCAICREPLPDGPPYYVAVDDTRFCGMCVDQYGIYEWKALLPVQVVDVLLRHLISPVCEELVRERLRATA